ncbi:MAG: hypothetical protein ACYTF6_02290 [Planctomycetota bacterium]
MNILTKICIVVLVPLILVACTVFLSLSVTVDNYRVKAEQHRRRAEGENAAHGATKDLLRAEQDWSMAVVDENTRTKVMLRDKRTEVRDKWEGLVEKQDRLDTGIGDLGDRVTKFQKVEEFFETRSKRLLARNDVLLEKCDKLAKDNVDLQDAIDESRAAVARLTNKVRSQEEQIEDREIMITELKNRIDELQDQLLKVRPIAELVRPPEEAGAEYVGVFPLGEVPAGAPKIVGKITAIRNDIASIDVGKNHGVKDGMKMVITHNATFVGYLQIEQVDIAEAAGIVTDKRFEPQVGDEVSYPPPAKID